MTQLIQQQVERELVGAFEAFLQDLGRRPQADEGDEKAAGARDSLASFMSPTEISKAERLAREWLKKHGK